MKNLFKLLNCEVIALKGNESYIKMTWNETQDHLTLHNDGTLKVYSRTLQKYPQLQEIVDKDMSLLKDIYYTLKGIAHNETLSVINHHKGVYIRCITFDGQFHRISFTNNRIKPGSKLDKAIKAKKRYTYKVELV